jgi:small-conductance mechanosensitive channel
MPFMAAALMVGGNLIGGMMQADAAQSAAQTQADAAVRAAEIQAEQRAPWVDAGKLALQRLQTGLAPGGEFRAQFSMADAMNAPAMQTALATGREAIEQSAASRGGLLTSNTLAGLTDYGQKVGAQYQNQAFNQYLAQLEANLKPIQSLAQVGQTEVGRVADTASNAVLTGGGALAGAQMAQGNIYGSAVSNLGTQLGQMSVLQGLFGPSGTSPSAPAAPIPMASPAGAPYSPFYIGSGST